MTRAITNKFFGKMPDGQDVYQYTLTNLNKIEVCVINYGGIITSIKVPDRNGLFEDVVLGYDSLNEYLTETPYFGAIVGRYANRIANGKFSIDGEEFFVARNNNGQHLHGGIKGFDKVYWRIEQIDSHALKLMYFSKDGEEGYPGNLYVEAMYRLTDDNELQIEFKASTDKKTIVNLTQHTYFNLSGNAKCDILDHEFIIYADRFVAIDEFLIPTGELKYVNDTPFDFNSPIPVGARISEENNQLKRAGGYDHCWMLSSVNAMKHAATVVEPIYGRTIDVFTTEPGMQFYSGNFLDGSITGKNGVSYKHRYGLCLETQHFPDSPNQKTFPTVQLLPGEIYKTQTIYKFGIR